MNELCLFLCKKVDFHLQKYLKCKMIYFYIAESKIYKCEPSFIKIVMINHASKAHISKGFFAENVNFHSENNLMNNDLFF